MTLNASKEVRKKVENKAKKPSKLSWGLGVEHEMLYAVTDHTDIHQYTILESDRLVELANIKHIRMAFDNLDAVLFPNSPSKIPRLFERIGGAFTRVMLSPDLLQDPYFGCCNGLGTEDVIMKTLDDKHFSFSDAYCVLIMMAPYLTHCLDSMFFALVATSNEDELLNLLHTEFLNQGPVIAELFKSLYIDPDKSGYNRVVAKVLSGSIDIYHYLEHIYTTLEKFMSSDLATNSRAGLFAYGRMRIRFPSITLTFALKSRGASNKKTSKKSSDKSAVLYNGYPLALFSTKSSNRRRLLIAAVIRLMQIQVDMDQVPWINVDKPFVEVKTLAYQNATVTSITKELFQYEANVTLIAEGIMKKPCHALPFSGYKSMMFMDPLSTTQGDYPDIVNPPNHQKYYAGSFHFWFTLPHEKETVFQNDFAEDHVKFAHVLQWMEPLLLSLCGGDPGAIGKGSASPRAAYRSTINRVGGIGTTNTCALWHTITHVIPSGYPLVYFESDESFNATFSDAHAKPELSIIDFKDRIMLFVDLPNGTTVPIKGCDETDREPRNGALIGHSIDEPLPPTVKAHLAPSTAISRTPHNQLLRLEYGAQYSVKDGSNVRILANWCDALRLRLRPYWQAYPVMVGDSLKLRFYNPMNGERSAVAPLRPEEDAYSSTNLTGFEFRLMDNMPRANVEPLLNLFVLLAAASKASTLTAKKCQHVQINGHWSKLVSEVMVKGRFAVPHIKYVNGLESMLGIKIDHSENVFDCLQDVCRKLYDRYKDHNWVAMMAPKLSKSRKKEFEPRLVDCNFDAWCDSFYYHIHDRPDIELLINGLFEKYCLNSEVSINDIESDLMFSLNKSYVYDVPYIAKYIHSVCKLNAGKVMIKKVEDFFRATLASRH